MTEAEHEAVNGNQPEENKVAMDQNAEYVENEEANGQ
jgi:hypothetical protein